MNNGTRIINSLRGCTFTNQEAEAIKGELARCTHDAAPVPLQHGERWFIRGEIWEVRTIIGDTAVMNKIGEGNAH